MSADEENASGHLIDLYCKPILNQIYTIGFKIKTLDQSVQRIHHVKTGSERKNYFAADYRKITIKTIDGGIIMGRINLASKQRVSDIFTKSDTPFIVIVDAISKDVEGKTLFVNKEHIIWVEPEEESGDSKGTRKIRPVP
jgi:hypothetical protein